MHTLARHFEEGGTGMYWVLTCSIVVWGLVLMLFVRLYRPRPPSGAVLARIQRLVAAGDLGAAVRCMALTRGELARVALAGLKEGLQDRERIEVAMAFEVDRARAGLRRRLPLLFTSGQIATLLGLLGALNGLVQGLGCVATVDASSRATALAAGISESMNCTAFGILVSMVAVGFGWMFDTRAELLGADLLHGAHAVQILLIRYRDRLRWVGQRAPVDQGFYRITE